MLETKLKEKGKKKAGRKEREAAAAEDKTPSQDLPNITTSNSAKLIKSA